MKAVVIGSSGTIGSAVSQLLRNKGHEVIEGSRSTQPVIDITDPASIENFFTNIEEVDVIVCAAGGAAFVSIQELSDEQVQFSANSKLLGQVNVVRKGLRRLRAGGVIVITGGFLAYAPAPATSMLTMVNKGLDGFASAAALDMSEGRRILIVHPPWVAETASALGMDPRPWPNAATTAEAYLAAIEGDQTGIAFFVPGYEPK